MIKVEFEFQNEEHLRDFMLRVSPMPMPAGQHCAGACSSAPVAIAEPTAPAAEEKKEPPKKEAVPKKAAAKKTVGEPATPMDADEPPRTKAETSTDKPISIDDLRAVGKEMMDRVGSAEGMQKFANLIKSYKCTRVSDIAVEDRARFVEDCNNIQKGDA